MTNSYRYHSPPLNLTNTLININKTFFNSQSQQITLRTQSYLSDNDSNKKEKSTIRRISSTKKKSCVFSHQKKRSHHRLSTQSLKQLDSLPNLSLSRIQTEINHRVTSPNMKRNNDVFYKEKSPPNTVRSFRSSNRQPFIKKATMNTFLSTSETDNKRDFDTTDSKRSNNVLFTGRHYQSQLSKISEKSKHLKEKKCFEDGTSTSKEGNSFISSEYNLKGNRSSLFESELSSPIKQCFTAKILRKKAILNLKSKEVDSLHVCSFTINNLIQSFKPVINNTIKGCESHSNFLNHFQIKDTLIYNEDKDNFLKNAINVIYNKISADFTPSRRETQKNVKHIKNYLMFNHAKELIKEGYFLYYIKKKIKSKQFRINFNIRPYLKKYIIQNYFNLALDTKLFKENYLDIDYNTISNRRKSILSNFQHVPRSHTVFSDLYAESRNKHLSEASTPCVINLTKHSYKYLNKFLRIDSIKGKENDEKRIIENKVVHKWEIYRKSFSKRGRIRGGFSNNISKHLTSPEKKPKKISLLHTNFYRRKKKKSETTEADTDSDNRPQKKPNKILLHLGINSISKIKDDISSKDRMLLRTNQIKATLQHNLQTEYEALLYLLNDGKFREFEKQFVEMGMDPNIQDKFGNTFLILAIQSNSFQIINFLLHNGADPNLANYKNNTPLHYALTFHNFEVADMLIQKGAKENITNNMGYTPWQCIDTTISIV